MTAPVPDYDARGFGVATGYSPRPSTSEARVARFFGLSGDSWLRHANPASVWTRFAGLWFLALAVWSRDWIGWWSLIPIAAGIVFVFVNPLLFPVPRSTRNWASKGVFGERVYAERRSVELPAQFGTRVPNVANALSGLGVVLAAYGLVVLDPVATVGGLVLTQTAKAWYIDRMVLLFDDAKTRNGEYASWEF
jgi:hypothetical protein